MRLSAGKVVVTPDTPRAGARFTASLRVVRRDTGAVVVRGRVTCVARVGTVSLRLVARGFRSGRAACTWLLPSSARGRSVAGSLRVDALGSFTRRYFGRPVI